jgi:hypothetical protein
MKVISDYLARYAEPEARERLSECRVYDAGVAVPLHQEGESFPRLLRSLETAAERAGSALAVLVVNAREDASPAALDDNARLLHSLGEGPLLSRGALDLWVIDRTSPGRRFPEKQGVGLARKIGCDLLLRLHAEGRLRSAYAHTTDGDAEVEPDYFALPAGQRPAVWLHPFTHEVGERDTALSLYEISLHHYVLGLRRAGSPYAFHTVGSTLAIRQDAYAMVRGFPRREAAEDFYLLSKLAKVGEVRTGGGTIRLAPRPSRRVPFGTGQGMAKIDGELARGIAFTLYHPAIFDRLGAWLAVLDRFAEDRSLESAIQEIDRVGLREAVDQLGAVEALRVARDTRPDRKALHRHLHTWFDGFRTLKLVHWLRDRELPNLPWREAVAYPEGPPHALLPGLRHQTNHLISRTNF